MDKEIGNTSMCIYQIVHWQSGKKYVGQTTSKLSYRWQRHCKPNSGCQKLGRAIQKYGKDKFDVSVLQVCDTRDQLNEREVHWIAALNSVDNGYNLQHGGNNFLFSDETRQKMSNAHKGKVLTEAHSKNIAAALRGKPKSEEHRQKMCGRTISPEQRKRLSEFNTGKIIPQEICQKISEIALARRSNLTQEEIDKREYARLSMQRTRSNKKLDIKIPRVYKNDDATRERYKLNARLRRERDSLGIKIPKRIAMTREERLLRDKIASQKYRDRKKLEKC